jgi:hypothetical protein
MHGIPGPGGTLAVLSLWHTRSPSLAAGRGIPSLRQMGVRLVGIRPTKTKYMSPGGTQRQYVLALWHSRARPQFHGSHLATRDYSCAKYRDHADSRRGSDESGNQGCWFPVCVASGGAEGTRRSQAPRGEKPGTSDWAGRGSGPARCLGGCGGGRGDARGDAERVTRLDQLGLAGGGALGDEHDRARAVGLV